MIIACPACNTRYAVPDNAIGVEGRTVRCAKCKHSWFQDGPEILLPPQPPAPEPALAQPEPEVAEAPPIPPERPVISEAGAEAGNDGRWSESFDSARSSFDYEPPFRPRRNKAKMWTIAAALFAVISLGLVGAVAWYGLPSWMPFHQPTFGEGQAGLVLEFPANRQDRRTLANGSEFFGASGKVTNVGSSRRTVPTILVILRDSQDRIVYDWEIVAPKRQLDPGESVSINEAVTDVPKSAKYAEIGWKPG